MDDAGTTPSSNRASLPREIQPGVHVCAKAEEVARVAARHFVDWAWQAIARRGAFAVAFSGGNTPAGLYRVLATSEFRGQIDWPRVQVFWSDERAVPHDHPDNNYGLARRELLLRVPIPTGNVHPMDAARADIGRAAQEYEEILRRKLPLNARGFPRFDLILLGLGADGHTASLFPGNQNAIETLRWVSTPLVEHLGTRRMTLTLPVINAAQQVLFLVTGAEKAVILRDVLKRTSDPALPAQLVTAPEGERMFLVDAAAAALLTRESSPPTGGVGSRPSGQG